MNQYEFYECFKNSVPWRASFAAPLNSNLYITPYPYWTGSALSEITLAESCGEYKYVSYRHVQTCLRWLKTSWKLITLANREIATMALKMCRGNSPETCLKCLCLKHRTSYTTDSDSDHNWSIGLALFTGNQWGFEESRIQVGYAVALLFSSFFHGWLRRGKQYECMGIEKHDKTPGAESEIASWKQRWNNLQRP